MSDPTKILLLNGPNLNLLGNRESHIYGSTSLDAIEKDLIKQSAAKGVLLDCYQSNHEGALIDQIHQAYTTKVAFILFNPGGFSHTSIAIRDALLGTKIPFIEIHLSISTVEKPSDTILFFLILLKE
jgi:3-dehydroquinate dehydratase-2